MRWSTGNRLIQGVFGAIAILWLAVVGCSRHESAGAPNAAKPGGPRIVSLSPAISRTLIDFQLQDRVVGRTPHCASLDQNIPVVGDLLNIDYERLIRLNPTHILIQPPESGIDQHLTDLAKQQGWKIAQWHLDNRDDIETMVRELPGALFDAGTPPPPKFANAMRQSADILNRIATALSPGVERLFHGRTLLMYSVDPTSVFGQGTYLNDVLIALGGTNASNAKQWAQLSLEDIVRLDPEAIIVVKPGADPKTDALIAAGPLGRLDIAAVRNKRIAVLTHPDAFTPSSGIIGVAEQLRAILRSFAENGP